MFGSFGSFGGGSMYLESPLVYSPVSTRHRYMYRLLVVWSVLEYFPCAEYAASTAKYTPLPNAVAVDNEI